MRILFFQIIEITLIFLMKPHLRSLNEHTACSLIMVAVDFIDVTPGREKMERLSGDVNIINKNAKLLHLRKRLAKDNESNSLAIISMCQGMKHGKICILVIEAMKILVLSLQFK